MLELLYVVMIVLGSCFIPYFLFASFQNMKFFLYPCQFIMCIFIISYHPYNKHTLWNKQDYQQMHKVPYEVIMDVDGEIYYTSSNETFSVIKTDIYSKECLENYFINNAKECPITDIIVERNDNNRNAFIGYETVQRNNSFIYYRRDYKYGKLYDIFLKSSFDYKTVEIIKRREENKLLNHLIIFKNYIHYSDIICLGLFIISFVYFFMESRQYTSWNYFRFIDYFLKQLFFH